MGETLRDGVVAVILREDRTLLIRRAEGVPHPGHWTPVSGKVEPNETQEAAAVREVREELGLWTRPLRRVWECRSSDGEFRLHWWQVELVQPDAVPTPDPREVSELRWVAVSELHTLEPTFEADRYFFAKVPPALSDPF